MYFDQLEEPLEQAKQQVQKERIRIRKAQRVHIFEQSRKRMAFHSRPKISHNSSQSKSKAKYTHPFDDYAEYPLPQKPQNEIIKDKNDEIHPVLKHAQDQIKQLSNNRNEQQISLQSTVLPEFKYEDENILFKEWLQDPIPQYINLLPINTAFHQFIQSQLIKQVNFQQIHQNIKSIVGCHDMLEVHSSLINLRKISHHFSTRTELPQIIIDHQIIPSLMHLIQQTQHPQLKFESAWLIANILSGTHKECASLVDKNIISVFMKMLDSNEKYVISHVLWGLGNIIADSSQYRDKILEEDIINRIVNLAYITENYQVFDNCIWILINISFIQPTPPYEGIRRGLMFILLGLKSQIIDQAYLSDSLALIISFINSKSYKQLRQMKIIQLCMISIWQILTSGILSHQNQQLLQLYLDILAKMTSYCLQSVEILLQQQFTLYISAIFTNLEHYSPRVIENITMIIYHITNTPRFIHLIAQDKQLISHIVSALLNQHQVNSFSQQSLWFSFGNIFIFQQTQASISLIQDTRITDILGDKLRISEYLDARLVEALLNCLQRVLQVGEEYGANTKLQGNPVSDWFQRSVGDLSIVQRLQYHGDQQIYKLSAIILSRYYSQRLI